MSWQPTLPDPKQQRLTRLQRRFRAIHRRQERRVKLRRWARSAVALMQPIAVTMAVAGVVFAWWLTTLPPSWSWSERLLHLAAAPNCSAAHAAGLAPARRGDPGYFVRHDADDDGVACEPIQRAR